MRIAQKPADWRLIYEAFIHSDAWKAKRLRVMKRANALCESCLDQRAQEVHHLMYPSPITLATLANQPCYQLRALCQDCHDRVHGRPVRSSEKPRPWGVK